jgi:hypothetical protein
MEFHIAVSWVLYSIREIVGISSLRNDILKAFINDDIMNQIEFGNTFGAESKPVELQEFLESKIRQQTNRKRFFIFSGINRPRSGETHYQGFIIDYREKILYIADPAMTRDGPGIYKPFLAQQQVIPFFKRFHFDSQFILTSHPCQTSSQDVFCQSWSLYIMIQFLNNIGHIIPIPQSQIQRYGILLRFYKDISERVSDFCPILREYYLRNVSRHRSLVHGISSVQERKQRRNLYKSIDPCLVLQENMESKDMVDDEEDQNQQQN